MTGLLLCVAWYLIGVGGMMLSFKLYDGKVTVGALARCLLFGAGGPISVAISFVVGAMLHPTLSQKKLW